MILWWRLMGTHTSGLPSRVSGVETPVFLCSAAMAACLMCLPLPLAAWLSQRQQTGRDLTSPLTNLPLEHLHLSANRALANVIASLAAAGVHAD